MTWEEDFWGVVTLLTNIGFNLKKNVVLEVSHFVHFRNKIIGNFLPHSDW